MKEALNGIDTQGFIVLQGLAGVLDPVRRRLEALLRDCFAGAPGFADFDTLSTYLNERYMSEREALLHVYSVLDRTPELVRAGVSAEILDVLRNAGLADPILSSYPTWRLDLHVNPPQRTFPWHQEKYHDLFSDRGVSIWAPLHAVSATLPSNTLWVKPGSHRFGVLRTGQDKFDIVDERVAGLRELPLNLEFGEAVLFSNLLLHRSGAITHPYGMRLSLQFRYDDLNDAEYRGQGWPANFKLVDAGGSAPASSP